MDLNLEAIDPKAWFKSSKGVSAATFANITPVAPIKKMKKEDIILTTTRINSNKGDIHNEH